VFSVQASKYERSGTSDHAEVPLVNDEQGKGAAADGMREIWKRSQRSGEVGYWLLLTLFTGRSALRHGR
jgi:hypothetical protein